MDVYILDKYVYWTISLIVDYIRLLSNVKLVLLINWWVIIYMLVVF